MLPLILSGGLYIPKDSRFDIDSIKKGLTVKTKPMGADEPIHVKAYHEEKEGYLCVPRDYGARRFSNYELLGRTTLGSKVEFTGVISPRNIEQATFIDDTYNAAIANNDFIAKAFTGFGKTISALVVVKRLGRTTLILVDQDNLLQQWKERAKQFLALKDEEIGVIQGKKCEYQGKKFVIGMMQTLWQKKLAEEVYNYFGTVVLDEVHAAGAPATSRVLMQFAARYRFGISATPKRRDALNSILEWNLGRVLVTVKAKHQSSSVYYVTSDTTYSWYANVSKNTGRILSEISEDAERNLKLSKAIKWLADTGRSVLVLSDRIEHLENLMALCYYSGIPEEDMGLCAGYRTIYSVVKDPTPPRRPKYLEKGTEYSPVTLERLQKRIPKQEINYVKDNIKIVFTTFKMFEKGVDVPRLAGGIDCSPRSQSKQVHGRILRTQKGKLTPLWVTVRDVNSYRAEYQFYQRIAEYAESSAEIYEWNEDLGIRRRDTQDLRREVIQRHKLLRDAKIITALDGRNTVVIQSTPK